MRGLDLRCSIRCAAIAAAMVLAVGACAPADEAEGGLALAVYALDQCTAGAAPGAPAKARIHVRGGGVGVPCEVDGQESVCFLGQDKVGDWGDAVSVGGVPEGSGWEVTVLGYSGAGEVAETPLYYARSNGIRIRKGENTVAEAILSRFGGMSCPVVEDAFPQRVFASVTSASDGRVVVAGGFTGESGGKLTTPDGGVYVYEPLQGRMRKAADLARPRAGHAAVYLPEQQWVVFFGGTDELAFDPSGAAFPITFTDDDADQAFSDFEIFDLSTETMFVAGKCPSDPDLACCEPDGSDKPNRPAQCEEAGKDCARDACFTCDELSKSMARRRVFAQPMVMSDGFVLLTGGGDWPLHEEPAYRAADVFDAEANCGAGGFQDDMLLPRTEAIRAGHTATFVEANDAGRFRYLLWGGTGDSDGLPGEHAIAETYVESSQQFKGISGVFQKVYVDSGDAALVPNLYFHTTTPLTERRFLVAGGVRGGGSELQAPLADELYLVTLSGDDEIRASIEAIPGGIGTGRFLHTASSHDGRRVMILGGGTGFPTTAVAEPRAFDVKTRGFATLVGDAPIARLGHRHVLLPDDTILLVGGLQTTAEFGSGTGLLEVYTPSVLNPLWD